MNGAAYAVTNPIAGTDDDVLYQSERFSLTEYRFDVAPGVYQVTLRFENPARVQRLESLAVGLPEVQAVCTQVLILRNGRAVHQGPLVPQRELHRSGAFRVRLDRPPPPEDLLGLPAVATALAGEDGVLLVNLAPGLPPSALARALVEGGWGLRELTPERTDLERIYFETLGLELRLQREQAGLFYQAVTRSDHHLLITRPYLSEDGEEWEESAYWKAIARLFEKSAVTRVTPDTPQPLVQAASTQELLFAAVRRRSLPLRFDFLLDQWHQLRHAQVVLAARRARRVSGEHEGGVGPVAHVLNQRYSPAQTWSASRLEAYSNCPFQFFVGSALGLEPRALPAFGLGASQMGSILHKVLEETYLAVPDPMNLDSLLGTLRVESKKVFANAPREFGFRPSALWEIEQEQWLEKLETTITALTEDSQWVPFAYEAEFGLDGAPPLQIEFGDEVLQVHGVIDRVERNSQGQLRVVDYKTGSTHLSQKDLERGYRLQLPIYALAARDALGLGDPVDGLYWKILNAEAGSLRLAKCITDDAEGMEAAIEITRGHLLRIITGIRAAQFPPKRPDGGCPSYCAAAQWCWRYEPGW